MSTKLGIEPDLKFIYKLKKAGGESVKKCYQCATCSVVCNLSPLDRPFPRKEMLWAQWGQLSKLAKDVDVWLCYQCNDCTLHCPRGARPGDVLAAIRTNLYEYYAFPSFLGKAVANPWALPLLFLVPILLMFGLVWSYHGGEISPILQEKIKFDHFIPHLWIEILFISGNILIFLCVFISLWKFWKALEQGSAEKRKLGFIPSAILAFKDILSHINFKKCEANKIRYIAHILVFFGFIGAMITAGLAAAGLYLFNFEPPIPMGHPIKWLGNISGLAGFIGLTILILKRLSNREKVGANGYSDWLFLVVLYLVFITGLATQFIRLANSPMLAYGMYYVHLVLVFFLLWYAPYSKFAHIFYRTLAIIHAKSVERKSR